MSVTIIDIDVDPAHLFRYISQLDPRKAEKVIIILKLLRLLRRGPGSRLSTIQWQRKELCFGLTNRTIRVLHLWL